MKKLDSKILSYFAGFVFSIIFLILLVFQLKTVYAQVAGEGPITSTLAVSIIRPSEGEIVSGVVEIEASASSDNGIWLVDFQADGMPIASDSAAPYIVNWDTSGLFPGSWHILQAFVYDLLGNSASSSALAVQIASPSAIPSPTPTPSPSPTPTPTPSPTPSPTPTPTPTPTPSPTPQPTPATPDLEPPTVNITDPVNGSRVRKNTTITIQANAFDNIQVSKVEFFVNNQLLCTDVSGGYSCNWSIPKWPGVYYDLKAKAYDPSGNSSSHVVTVRSK